MVYASTGSSFFFLYLFLDVIFLSLSEPYTLIGVGHVFFIFCYYLSIIPRIVSQQLSEYYFENKTIQVDPLILNASLIQ